ncbi:MAG: PAS domain-containing protein, partial [Planctomycetes bacterium]|nr:PAS domain-containing protein [Planctomycetota bacterium]
MTIGDIMDGVVFVDREGLIAVINPVAEDLLDVRGLLAVGKTPGQVAADDQRELAKALVVEIEAASVAGTAHRTVEIHHGERDLHYVDLRVSTVRDAEDRPAGKLVVLRDVTKEFKADQLRNQYLSIVAHELRTPLTGIKTYSTMLAKRSLGELQPNQATAIESIREQCIRLEHQIDKLVNLGHIDSSNYARDLDEIDVIAVLRGAVEPFRGVAADAGVKLELEEPTDGCKVRADRVDLGRALKAIIENAIKFTPEGGRVAVSAEVADGWVTFVVSDSGIGIDPRYQRRIFEKFFQ